MTVTHTAARGPIDIVTVTASEEGWRANSHLLVLESSVLLVDTPLLDSDADVVARELSLTGKPLAGVIITHPHPDHFATASRFGAPVRALPAVAESITMNGAGQVAASYAVTGIADPPPAAPTVTGTITPGTELIDGVTFEFAAVENAEAAVQLVIRAPAAGVLLTGDLASAGVHPFLAGRSLGPWVEAVEALRAVETDVILPGHGVPTGPTALDQTISYLRRARTELAEAVDAADLDARLDAAFPDLGGRRMHALQNRFIFP